MGRSLRCSVFVLLALFVATLLLTSLGVAPPARAEGAGAPTVVREVPEKRSEYATTYLLSNGTYRAVFSQAPVHFRDASGAWQPVNATLLPAGAGTWKTAAAPLAVTVGDEAPGKAAVTVEADGHLVALDLLGCAEDTALVLGETALYADVASASDVTYTVTGDALRELITLHSAAAPNTFTYRLSHPGLTLAKDGTDAWALFAPGATDPTFVIGPLCVMDSAIDTSGQGAICPGATMTVAPGAGASTITYAVPRSWLSDRARVWPVKIDPDLFSRAPTDVYLSSQYPGTAEGTADPQNLFCGKVTSTNNCRTLIKFPQITDNISAGARVNSATLQVRQYAGPSSSYKPHVYYLNAGSSLWGEGATWNNTTLDSTEIDTSKVTAPNGSSSWMVVDCLDIVQNWVDRYPPNKGFQVRQLDAEGTAYGRKFRSGEYSDAAYRPSITVNYTAPSIEVTSPGVDSPVCQGRADSISWSFPTQSQHGSFTVQVVSSGGTVYTLASGILANGADNYSYSWTPTQPVGAGWTAKVTYYDAYGASILAASSSTFDIFAAPTVTSPNGGESWLRGSVHTVTWSVAQSPPNGHFHVEYGIDGGAWYTIADDLPATARSCDWTILMTPSTGWGVRVTCHDAGNRTVASDESDGPMTFVECSPHVTAPNGGESLYLGSAATITWTAPVLTYGHFTVELLDASGTPTMVNSNVPPNGTTNYSVPWTVDQAVASGWKVRVTYYNAGYWISSDVSDGSFAIIPDEEVQHTVADLGSWDGYDLACQLDVGRLTASATDLAIASLGPPAALTRSYLSGEAATRFAPGWRFGFEQKLVFALGADPASVTYVDEAQGTHAFYRADASSLWQPPNGYFAHLTQNGDGTWKLLYDDQHYLTFAADGTLLAETDAHGLSTTYSWSSSQVIIQAANAQQIVATLDGSGTVTGASYATGDGTRTVAYSGSGTSWHVSYNAADSGVNGTARTLDYTYTGGLLSEIAQPGWPEAGKSAVLRLTYSGTQLTGVNYPDMYATDAAHTVEKPDARATISYGSNQATLERYGTYVDAGGVTQANAAMQPVEYHWEPASSPVAGQETHEIEGTGADASLTKYEYSPDQQVASTTTFEGDDEYGDVLEEWEAAIDADEHEMDDEALDTGEGSENIDQVTTYTYDEQHQVTDEAQIAQPSPSDPTEGKGTTTLSTYDAAGNVIEEWKEYREAADATPVVCAYTRRSYDAAGHLTIEKQLVSADVVETGHLASGETPDDRTITNPVWAETDYSDFALCGEPQTIEAKAVKLRLAHDGQAEVVADLTKTASYDEFGSLESETDWGGRTTQQSTHDLAGRQLTSTDAAGVVTHTSYDLLGNATTSFRTATGTSMLADWSATAYDAMGRAVQVTTKLSDAYGNLTTQKVVTSVYDGSGHQLSAHDSTVGGQDEKWVYDASGNVTKHWALGVAAYDEARATRTAFDAKGQPTGESRPGNTAEPGAAGSDTTSYDDAGQVVSQQSADGSTSAASYDGAGSQLEDQSSATGSATSVYGADGRLVSQTDASGLTTTYGYDLLGRVIGAEGSTSPGSPTTTTYNNLGWILRTADSSGVTVSKDYDAHGNLEYETRGSAGTIHWTYDALNRVETQEDPNGDVLTNTYGSFGNLHEQQHEDWNSVVLKDLVTDHDSLGRPTSQSDSVSGVSRTWEYPLDTIEETEETLSYDATPLTRTVVTRNLRNVETSRETAVASGATVSRAVSDDAGGRDGADRWTSATLQLSGFSALTLGRAFDNAGRIVTQSGAGLSAAGSYGYDSSRGLKTSQQLPLQISDASAPDNYTYWDDGRLKTWSVGPTASPTPMATYTYDPAGNLTDDGATTFVYDAATCHLTSSTTGGVTTEYGWDSGNGWRTSQGPSSNPDQIQYTYAKSGATTSNGRMTAYSNSATGKSATYAYDASGQRTHSDVIASGTERATDFTYDGMTLLKLSATEGSSSWRIDYLYDEEGSLYGGVYRSPASSTSPTFFAAVTNNHGDVLELLDADGVAFAAYRYDPWGKPIDSGNYAVGIWKQGTTLVNSDLAGDIASRQVLRYASYAYDEESSLYYCSARYYDPATRQWTTGDLAKADGEESAWQYCGGEPVGCIDATGELDYSVNTPSVKQVGKNWCWAASAVCVLRTKGISTNQYKVAHAVLGSYDDQALPDAQVGHLTYLLNLYLGPSYYNTYWRSSNGYPWSAIVSCIKNRKPIIVAIRWGNGPAGHMMVIYRVRTVASRRYVYWMDPTNGSKGNRRSFHAFCSNDVYSVKFWIR